MPEEFLNNQAPAAPQLEAHLSPAAANNDASSAGTSVKNAKPAQSNLNNNNPAQALPNGNSPAQLAAENAKPAQSTLESGKPAQLAAENAKPAQSTLESGNSAQPAALADNLAQVPAEATSAANFTLDITSLLADPNLSKALQADPELGSEFSALSTELGIGQEQAEKLAGLYARSLSRHVEKFSADHAEMMRKTEATWLEELKADSNFTTQVSKARAAIKNYGEPALINVLEETRLGSHPAFVRFMAKVGAELAEPSFAGRQANSQNRSPAEVLYPNQGR